MGDLGISSPDDDDLGQAIAAELSVRGVACVRACPRDVSERTQRGGVDPVDPSREPLARLGVAELVVKRRQQETESRCGRPVLVRHEGGSSVQDFLERQPSRGERRADAVGERERLGAGQIRNVAQSRPRRGRVQGEPVIPFTAGVGHHPRFADGRTQIDARRGSRHQDALPWSIRRRQRADAYRQVPKQTRRDRGPEGSIALLAKHER